MSLLIPLATAVFSDLSLIGKDRAAMNLRAFELDQPVRAPILLVEKVRLAAMGGELPDGCEDVLWQICSDVDNDVVRLLHATLAQPKNLWDSSGSWLPSFLATEARGPDVSVSPERSRDVADSHLHSGAAIALSDLTDLLILSEWSVVKHEPLVSVDATGQRFDVGVLANGLRHFLQYVCAEEDEKPRRILAPEISRGTFWAKVALASVGSSHEDSFVSALRCNDGPSDPAFFLRWFHHQTNVGLSVEMDRVNVFACLSLLSSTVSSRTGEGLPRFVDRFEQMGLLRDRALRATRVDIVAKSCASVFSSEQVVAAEFRKTIGGRTAGSSLRDSLRDHLQGFIEFSKESKTPRRFSMPVSFARQRVNSAPAIDEFVLLFRLHEIWPVYAAYLDFRDDFPSLVPYVSALDVVGNENWTGNWPYCALYDDLRVRLGLADLSFTVHAGEFYRWRLEGLRSIGELVLPNCVVDRIGHALALDAQIPPTTTRPTVSLRDMAEDLLWVICADLEVDGAHEMLDAVVESAGLPRYGVGATALLAGWRCRRTLAGLTSMGIVGPDPRARPDWPKTTISVSEFLDSEVERRALIALVYRGSGALLLLDRVDEVLSERYLEWADTTAELVTGQLETVLVANGVVVESCPTSNVRLSRIDSFRRHPLARFIERGMDVSVSSDDPLIFGTNIVKESALVAEIFGDQIADQVAATGCRVCCPNVLPLTEEDAESLERALIRELPQL